MPDGVVEAGVGGDASDGFSAKTLPGAIVPQTSATISRPANDTRVVSMRAESPEEIMQESTRA
jgi:hypothetical protein